MLLTCLRRKPVREEQAPYNEQDPDDIHHSHQTYAFDNDQSLYEEYSPNNSRPTVLDADIHNGRTSGLEQADDPEQAQEVELSNNLVMEVLTACNVDVDTAFHNEPHFDINKTNDIEHAPYQEMSVNVDSKSKSVCNDLTSCNVHTTFHNGTNSDLVVDSEQGLYEEMTQPVFINRTDETATGDSYVPPVSLNVFKPVGEEETSNEVVSEKEQGPDVYHPYEYYEFLNSQKINKDEHQQIK